MEISKIDSFKNKKNNPEESIILHVKFQRRTLITISFMLFLIIYFYKASFYHNVIKVQWQHLTTKQQKDRLKINNFIKGINALYMYLTRMWKKPTRNII